MIEWPPDDTSPATGQPDRITTADVASVYPVLAALSDAWAWRVWDLPGSAAATTLVGELVCGGVMTTVFVQTDDTASVWWLTVTDQRTLGTVHGRLAEVVDQITGGHS